MNKALYYPYINIPKDNWLTQSLLYWDELSCIAPSIYFENPNLYEHHIQEYIREQLVIPLSPQYFINDILGFEENFIDYIDNDKLILQIRKDIREGKSMRYTNIHFEKLGPLCNELIQRNLAFKGKNGWLLVEANLALKFMTYLSLLIGSIKDYDPITREDISIYDFHSLSRRCKYQDVIDEKTIINEFRPRVDELGIKNSMTNTRDKILTNLLPSPNMNISAMNILRFKEKNRDSLVSFREYVEKFLIEYESTEDSLKARLFVDFIYKSKNMKDEIINDMNKFGWYNFDFFDFGLFGLDIYSTFSAYQEFNIKNMGVALTSFGITVFKGLKSNKNRIRDLNKKPMAYVVNSNKKFK